MLRSWTLATLWQQEFRAYSWAAFQRDLLAGLTVAAVALPLALAFGVASGATPAAGLVTAILAGVIIGSLSGAPYQISGPTGAMTAVLVGIIQKHGLPGVWLACVLAGGILLLLGLFKLGRIISFIPAPVITGFTSGIALIIFIGQIDNFLGVQTAKADTSALKLIQYGTQPLPPVNGAAILCAGIVMLIMVGLPRVKATAPLPAALIGIMLATAAAWIGQWPVTVIGAIPATIFLDQHLVLTPTSFAGIGDLIAPAGAIAALGAIESLLAGTVAGRMTGIKMNSNQELIAQGVGNLILPFFGGVPATAAIARISVGIKAGGATRLVSIIHSVALLGSALFLGGIIAHIPLAALAGVLMVTAWRMNEWHTLRFYLARRLKSPLVVLGTTLIATVALDLTQAIVIGVLAQLLFFVSQITRLRINSAEVDWDRLRAAGHTPVQEPAGIQVVYVSGPLFFGAASQLGESLEAQRPARALILSLRGVPLLDASGLHLLEEIWHRQLQQGGCLYLAGLQPPVEELLRRGGLVAAMGEDKLYWGSDQAILAAATRLTDGTPCEGRPGHPWDAGEDQRLDEELPLGVVTLLEPSR